MLGMEGTLLSIIKDMYTIILKGEILKLPLKSGATVSILPTPFLYGS